MPINCMVQTYSSNSRRQEKLLGDLPCFSRPFSGCTPLWNSNCQPLISLLV